MIPLTHDLIEFMMTKMLAALSYPVIVGDAPV